MFNYSAINMVRAVVALCVLTSSSAFALNGTSFVSNAGSDSNSCAPNLPCRTFQRAHDQTNANGIVIALDAVFDTVPLVVTKGMRFFASSADSAARPTISVTSGNAVTINAPANNAVTISNFALQGGATAANGIQFNSGAALNVIGGEILAFSGAAPNGFGIRFQPSGVSHLAITDTAFFTNGSGSTGGAIQISPVGAGGGAQTLLTRTRLEFNVFGFAIDTTNSSNGINAIITDSQIQKNFQDGIVIVGGAPIGLLVRDSIVFANSSNGVRAIGSNVAARLLNTTVAGNGIGVAALSGGAILSFGNNSIEANATNGTVSGPISLK